MSSQSDARTWLDEMLVDEASQGLSETRRRELDRLVDEVGLAESERGSYQLAAAAASLAFADRDGSVAELPSRLEANLLESADRFLSSDLRKVARGSFGARSRGSEGSSGPEAVQPTEVPPGSSMLAWWLAAAALLLAVLAWWPALTGTVSGPSEDAPPERSTGTLPNQIVLAMQTTDDPLSGGASGELRWSTETQSGTMTLIGLPANLPSDFQYQLWIFDRSRDERFPVDGGVFDVPVGAQRVEIPIDARIRVTDPTLFAITVEPPGGVVVSEREHIVLVASVA